MKEVPKTFHITDSAVHNVTNKTAYLVAVVMSAVDLGSNWTVGIRDKQAAPMYAVPPMAPKQSVSATEGTFKPPKPMLMQGGIDIVSAGGTPGAVDVWIWYETQP